LQGLVREHRRKIWGDTEVGVEVAGDHRSHAAVALNTGFCSECHLIEFLRQSDFGVFQQDPPKAALQHTFGENIPLV
jgi:hypothetical protein